MELTNKKIGPLRLAGLPHAGAYQAIGDKWHQLFGMVGQGLLPVGPETQMLGVYYHDPRVTPEADLRAMASLSVPKNWNPPEGSGLELLEIGEKEYVTCIHAGPYDGLGETWMQFAETAMPGPEKICDDKDRGPSLEIYLNNPMDTAPADLRTMLCGPAG